MIDKLLAILLFTNLHARRSAEIVSGFFDCLGTRKWLQNSRRRSTSPKGAKQRSPRVERSGTLGMVRN